MIEAVKRIFGVGRKSVIDQAVKEDLTELSEIHRESFPRGWTDGEFEALLAQENYFCLVMRIPGNSSKKLSGFVMVKKVLDEAEIISIATRLGSRRRGVARRLMDAAVRQLNSDRAESLFLEVDSKNNPAISLYKSMGFEEIGTREGYYSASPESEKKRSAALVMRLQLG